MPRRHLRALVLAGSLALGVPALALAAPSATPSRVAGGTVDAALTEQLAAPDGHAIALIAHGDSFADVSAALAATDMPVLVEFPLIDAIATAGTAEQIESLAESRGITHLEADVPLVYTGDTSHVATRSKHLRDGYTVTVPPKGDDATSGGDETTDVHVQADGAGVSVAIIDSGVDGTHPMFEDLDAGDGSSRVKVNKKILPPVCAVVVDSESLEGSEGLPCFGPASADFSDPEGTPAADAPDNDSDTISAGGHGTHVAGIAAGGRLELEDGRVIVGAAPKATIIALSTGVHRNVITAVQAQYWVLENHADPCGDGSCPPIRVVNNSYGPEGGGEFDAEAATVEIQRQLAEQGVVTVWAAGNDGGNGADNRSNPSGQDPTPGVLMVAGYDDQGTGTRDGRVAPFSSRGLATSQATWPDIAAPGTDITSACRARLTMCSSGEGDAGTISGTSMATPHVTGIVAQLFGLVPEATPAQIENVIEDTARQFSFGAPYTTDFRNADHTSSFDKGHGLIDAVAAANELLGLIEAPAVPGLPTCGADDPVVVDEGGDAILDDDGLPLVSIGDPGDRPSEDVLDIRSVSAVETQEGIDVVFTMAGVTGAAPDGTDGYRLHLEASWGGEVYYVEGTLSVDPLSGEVSENFGIDVLDGSVYSEIIELTGDLDVDAGTITVHVTNEAIERYNGDTEARGARPEIPVLADGVVLSELAALSQSSDSAVLVATLTPVDEALGLCNYEYGTGTVSGRAPTETPDDNDSGVDPDGNPTDDGDAAAQESPALTVVGDVQADALPGSTGAAGSATRPSATERRAR